jgi:glycine cleavage system H protein
MHNQIKILVIDDEKVIRDGCTRILSKDGYFVISAKNGEAGLAELDKTPEFDVILLDLMMPGMSGIEFLEKVQAVDNTFVVIVITGYASVGNAVEAIEKGAHDFIAKPFSPERLSITVKKALEWRTMKQPSAFDHSIYYHPGHSWAMPEGDNMVKVGIDDFTQKLVGKIDALKLPEVGSQVTQGEKGWSLLVGSKSIDMLSPVDGKIVDINEALLRSPESIGKDPYNQSWLLRVQVPKSSANLKNLLSGTLARKWMEGVREDLYARTNYNLGPVSQDGGIPVDGIARNLDRERWDEIVKDFFLIS